MEVDKKDWHVRWFFFMHELWHKYYKKDGDSLGWYEVPKNTDVCYFIRTTVLYPLLILISWILAVGLFFTAIIGFPAFYLGGINYIVTLLSMGGVIGIIYLINTRPGKKVLEHAGKPLKKTASGFGIAVQWVKDGHNRVCTVIKLGDK